ncbi:unnamed protein product, partial [Phaeothamnion confervicola]
VADLIKSLGASLVYPDSGNFETNRKASSYGLCLYLLWDAYAGEWDPEAAWVRRM